MDFKGQKSTPYIVDILHQHGVEYVIICPGSRNAPFTLAFNRHGKFNCLSIVDERSAGYFALGLAQSTTKPVAIVCTSGTATLNFAPAIAEAFHQQIPLIVLTADRPESWINQQDGQAMEQKGMYANIIAQSYHLKGELHTSDDLWHTEKVTNEAVHIAQSQSRPVHINVSFAESLYAESFEKVNARKVTDYSASAFFSYWAEILKNKRNVFVVVGQVQPDMRIIEAAKRLNNNSNVVLIAENLSNIPAEYTLFNITETISKAATIAKPDAIVYLGGPIVSKQLKRYIASLKVPVIRVQLNNEEVDTFQNNISLVRQSVADGLETLANHFSETKISSDFAKEWRLIADQAKKSRDHYTSQLPFCDLKVFQWISKNISSSTILHLGNSTPVRYAQIFNDHYLSGTKFYSNRGTSGIDGSTSTAVGFSYANPQTNILISGDLSFQYDANAFFNKYVKGNLKVIVINNSGGNIFRVIEGPREQKEREDFFETAIKHEFSNYAKHFNLNYFSATHERELMEVWDEFLQTNNRPSILEVFTDSELSANTFKEFYKYLQS